MVDFQRLSHLPDGKGMIDVADLFSPEIIFRHVGESSVGSYPTRRGDTPACLLKHLSMKRANGGFARIDPSTGQLQFRDGLGLMGQENVFALNKNGVDARAIPVPNVRLHRFFVPPHHGLAFRPKLLLNLGRGMPTENLQGNPMITGSPNSWDDAVLPFQLDDSDVRGRMARLGETLDCVLAKHDYPTTIESLIVEAALLTALIGQTIKLRWKLSLQIRGNGPIRLIATDNHAPVEQGKPARLRAYAGFDENRIDAEGPGFPQIGEGYFAILIDQGDGTTPYQGITPLSGSSLADCAETFFAQSEQLPSRFALACGRSRLPGTSERWRAGGIMLQHMPMASQATGPAHIGAPDRLPEADILNGSDDENWRRVNLLLDTVDDLELIGPHMDPRDLLVRLFHQEGPRAFPVQPVRFGCSCSAERVRRSLSIYSASDIKHMTTDQGIVTADCQFCGAHYRFDPDTLGFEAKSEVSDDS